MTTVRDQDSGAELDVARGKGAAAMKRFERKIATYKENIKPVSMDMASSYTSWAAGFLPNAMIVIDRFHVIKALNGRVDKARRKVMAMVDEGTAKKITGNRYVFLKNREDLTPKEEKKLARGLARQREILLQYASTKTGMSESPACGKVSCLRRGQEPRLCFKNGKSKRDKCLCG